MIDVIDVIYRSMWLECICLRLEFHVIHGFSFPHFFFFFSSLLTSSHLIYNILLPQSNLLVFYKLEPHGCTSAESPPIHSAHLYQSS